MPEVALQKYDATWQVETRILRLGQYLFAFSFSNLLSPHSIVQALFFQKIKVAACFDDLSLFQDINPVCMHNGRQSVCDHYRNVLALISDMPDGI